MTQGELARSYLNTASRAACRYAATSARRSLLCSISLITATLMAPAVVGRASVFAMGIAAFYWILERASVLS